MPELTSTISVPQESERSRDEVDQEICQLTRSLSRGEEDAWRSFYQNYHPRLRGLLRVLWKGPDEIVDDLLQETFLRAVKYMRVFSNEEALWSWLTVLARSATVDAGRKRGRWQRFLDRFTRQPAIVLSSCPHDLNETLAHLPEKTAELLQFKYDECWSVREIARHFQVTEKTIESRLTRARQQLRKELKRRSS